MDETRRMDQGANIHQANVAGDAKESVKPQTAFRRASAVFLKLLPQNNDPTVEDGGNPNCDSSRNEDLGKLLSTCYCKTLVLVGLVLSLAEVLVDEEQPDGPSRKEALQTYYLGFYVFLCAGSLLYLIWMYASMVKDRTVVNIINSYRGDEEAYNILKRRFRGPINRYGSFYLRLGAIAFGVGSMVYSGLEFGRGVEIYHGTCAKLQEAIPPAFRLLLTIAQMQFIFLNNQNMDLCSRPTLSRFGLMHLIATNLCEWLNVIIQESKHDIEHIEDQHSNTTSFNESEPISSEASAQGCSAPLMGSLVNDVSPFLFPCTIEYSLICAVIMLDMWMDVRELPNNELLPNMNRSARTRIHQASHVFTVDCASAHKGLLFGVMVLVSTIISQILYFVYMDHNKEAAQISINICETVLYVLSSLATLFAYIRLRSHASRVSKVSYNMDTCLILLAQLGVSLYSVFRLIGLLLLNNPEGSLYIELLRLIQSIGQTVFMVYGQSLVVRSRNSKPARQLITFLLPCNISLWTINTFVRNRANSDPQLNMLFNAWAWTTVKRIAMPLAIFYRFHSTICLFEMWKNAYKRVHGSKTGHS